MPFLIPVYIIIICSHLYACASFQFILTYSLGVLTFWICIFRFVAIYCWSGSFGEDHRHLDEPEFCLTRLFFLDIFCLFFIPSLSWFYALELCLFHFLFICHHVWMFIYDIAVILIYYSDYIVCSGYFRLNVYVWVFFSRIYVVDSHRDSVSTYFEKRRDMYSTQYRESKQHEIVRY